MAFSERSLDDYVDVAQRIADFREQYPHGSLRGDWRMEAVGSQVLVAYRAEAWRTPDDKAPGVGCAWELVPGRTPFTRGSELQNAETSAWGRAIIAVGASDAKKGVASREEVRNRRTEGLPCPVCGSFFPDCGHRNADGSLSRSRTTDEQKAAAGVMTKAQLAEHTALQPKQAEVRGKVRRMTNDLTGPRLASLDDDPWLDQPAGSLPETNVEDRPGTIGPGQLRKIQDAYKGKDRAARLADISRIIGRTVTSSNELSYTEAGRVLERLHEQVKA